MNRTNQRGSAAVGITIGVVAAAVLLAVVGSYVSAANYGNTAEVELKAKYADNQNVYANGTQKVIEMAQVPDMYVDAVSKVTRDAIGGRYGQDGSKAVFQMLREQNPQIDPSMFIKIQQTIEAFRNEFQHSQTALLDRCATYEKQRGYVFSGFWLRLAGYPKMDITNMCTIVTTDKTAKTFETKRDSGLQLRPSK